MRALLLAALLLLANLAHAQSMTFQGQLKVAGVPANGNFDLRFTLFDAPTAGAPVSAVACADDVQIADGLCTVILPFTLPTSGLDSYMEVQVRGHSSLPCSDSTGYTTLSPRQRMTPAPAAVFASVIPQAAPSIPGAIRFNPTTKKFEGYDGAYWAPFTQGNPIAPTEQQTFSTPGSSNFTVPAGVTRLGVDIHAGGGGGGARGPGNLNPTTCSVGQTGFAASGGGGAAGSSGRFVIDVTPGEVLTVTVGFGGLAGTTGAGGSGTASRIRRTGNTVEVITAPAGAGGSRPSSTVAMGAGVGFCTNGAGGAGASAPSNPILLGSGTPITGGGGGFGNPGNGPSCIGGSPGTFCGVAGGVGGAASTIGSGSPFTTSGAAGGDGGGYSTAAQPGDPGNVRLWWY